MVLEDPQIKELWDINSVKGLVEFQEGIFRDLVEAINPQGDSQLAVVVMDILPETEITVMDLPTETDLLTETETGVTAILLEDQEVVELRYQEALEDLVGEVGHLVDPGDLVEIVWEEDL